MSSETYWGFIASAQSSRDTPEPMLVPARACGRLPIPVTGSFLGRHPLLPSDVASRPANDERENNPTLLDRSGKKSIREGWRLRYLEATQVHDAW